MRYPACVTRLCGLSALLLCFACGSDDASAPGGSGGAGTGGSAGAAAAGGGAGEAAAGGGAGEAAAGGGAGIAGGAGTAGSAASGGAGGVGGEPGDNLVEVAHVKAQGQGPPMETVDVEVSGDHVYVCSSTRGLIVVDRAAAGLPIVYQEGGSAQHCQNVVVDGDVALTANRGDQLAPTPVVEAWNVADPANPTKLGELSDGDSYEGLAVVQPGAYYAVALHGDGVAILALPGSSPSRVATVGGLTNAWGLAASGTHLYVADDTGGVAIIDVSDPTAPSKVGSVALPGSATHLELGDGELYVSAGGAGVHVLSLADPASPSLQASFDTPGTALASAYADGHLFVADWNDVRILRVTDPAAPALIGTETPEVSGGFARVLTLDAAAGKAYIGEWTALYDYDFFPDRVAADIWPASYSIVFAETAPGGASAYSLVLENEGPLPLGITSLSTSPPFEVALEPTSPIPPAGNDFVEIHFKPVGPQPASGSLTITTDDPDESPLAITLTGNAQGISVGDDVLGQGWVWQQFGGGSVAVSSFAGKPVLLSYFATF
jgi:hypothetical protein